MITPDDVSLLEAYNLDTDCVPEDFSRTLADQVEALEAAVKQMGLREFLRHTAMRALVADQELQAAIIEAHDANACLEALVPPPGVTIH